MSKFLIIVGGLFAAVLVFAVMVAFIVMGYFNKEVGLRTRYDAQKMVVETTMDKMRKTLINTYKVNKEFAETYISCLAKVAEGRAGGSMFKMVTEASGNVNQGFTPEISAKMMNSISGEMSEFLRSQNVWIDVYREHKSYCMTMPQSFLIGGKVMPEPKIITSSVSKEAMRTGELDDNVIGSTPNKSEK